jgi:hypothetical protein
MLCGAPATTIGWAEPGLIQSAVMRDLKPGQQYYYVYGDVFGMSDEQTFRATPAPGTDDVVEIAAYGDMGKGACGSAAAACRRRADAEAAGELDGALEHWEEVPALNTTRLVIDGLNHTDLVMHIGDISYAVRTQHGRASLLGPQR